MKIQARHFSFLHPGFLMAGTSRMARGAASDVLPRKAGRWYVRPVGIAPLAAARTAMEAPLAKSAIPALPRKRAKNQSRARQQAGSSFNVPLKDGIEMSKATRGFTLIELLAIIAILAAILLPVLHSAQVRAQRAQCINNIKQCAGAILTFDSDNNSCFPPAGWASGDWQVSWDTLCYPYMGGGSPADPNITMTTGGYAPDGEDAATFDEAMGLKVLTCPFDTYPAFPKDSFMTSASGSLNTTLKDYEMISTGTQGSAAQGADNLLQRATQYGLPPVSEIQGVGIYWQDPSASGPNWNPPGYPDNVVRHPSGTIMLAEDVNNWNAEGNIWPCCVEGPIASGDGAYEVFYQIDPTITSSAQVQNGNAASEGYILYQLQQYRFNYAFHDGHVEALSYQQTCQPKKTGALVNYEIPNGMWNINTAD